MDKNGMISGVQEEKRRKEKGQEETVCGACIWFDRYEIKEILGEGGTGRVYLAEDIRLRRLAAIKILEPVTEQFSEEVRFLQELSLGILPVIYDAWVEENKTGVIIMEYVEGVNLKEYMALHRQISEGQIYEWGLQLGGFLERLHSGNPKILYRDLKLENIMVLPDRTLRLVDIGAAVRMEAESLCQKKRVGTFGYAAPEQWEGKRVDERADLYSLGAVLYAVVTGRKNGPAAAVESGKMPEGMLRALRRCMQPEKEKRYATARAFLADWKHYKRAGRVRSVVLQMEAAARYAFLYASVYILWYRREAVSMVWPFLAGYLWLKGAEWVWYRTNEMWEQKKSVWCRNF